MALKLVQLNIEGSRHLDVVIPFLKELQPDVACIQELREADIDRFKKELGIQCTFAPMVLGGGHTYGVGILSTIALTAVGINQYGGNEGALQDHVSHDKQKMHDSTKYLLLTGDFQKGGETFHIATTHFPVTDHGVATDFQRKDMEKMLELLEQEGEFVLTGDFNAPRGGEIFTMLAAKYKDNIPVEVVTSLDYDIHRAGGAKLIADAQTLGLKGLMVDGIFSTPGYHVSNVQGHTGVSDHCAFSAEISKSSDSF